MSPDMYKDTTKVKSERQRKTFTDAFIGGMFSEVYDCTPENCKSCFNGELVLPRPSKINESTSLARLELELKRDEEMLIYVVDGKIIQSFPIEPDSEYKHWRINTDKPSIYLYEDEKFFVCPWKKNTELPFAVTRQIKIEYINKIASNVSVNRLVYIDPDKRHFLGTTLEPFFHLSTSRYVNMGEIKNPRKWIEQSRVYYPPEEDFSDWELVYTRNLLDDNLNLEAYPYRNRGALKKIKSIELIVPETKTIINWDSLQPIE